MVQTPGSFSSNECLAKASQLNENFGPEPDTTLHPELKLADIEKVRFIEKATRDLNPTAL